MSYLQRLAHRIARTRTTLAAASIAATACSQGDRADFLSPFPNPTKSVLASIQIEPKITSAPVGTLVQFTARGLSASGEHVPATFVWSADGGAITPSGLYQGAAAGPFRVIARSLHNPDVADSAVIAVWQSPTDPVGLVVQPDSVEIEVGDTLAFSASLGLANGILAAGATVNWSTDGGQISNSGWYTSGSVGSYQVVASTVNGLRGTATVTVRQRRSRMTGLTVTPETMRLSPGQGTRFDARCRWKEGRSGSCDVSWRATIGTITPAGEFTAGSTEGNGIVVAQALGADLADTAAVTIASDAPVLVRLAVNPQPVSMPARASVQFGVVGTWSNGSSSTPVVSWSATGGTITSGGYYTAGSTAGSYRVVAVTQDGSKADTVSVTVSPPPAPTLTAVGISPRTFALNTGGVQQLNVSATWSDGTTAAPLVTWSTSGGSVTPISPSGGSVTTGGLYTAGTSPGTYRVIAASSGRADTATVTVTSAAAVLQSLTVSPKPVSMATAGTTQFTATARWSDGSTALPAVTWTATGGAITSSGLYTAGATAGTYRVIATGGGKADTAAVTLATPIVTSFALVPASATVATGGSQLFQASVTWSDGITRPVSVTYSATGGTVSVGGLYSAGSVAGAFAVIAACGCGLADTATVTVTSSAGLPQPPGAPRFTLGGNVQITWPVGSGATSYRFTAGPFEGSWGGASGSTENTSASLGVVPPGTPIWACVRSVNGVGQSADEACNSITIPVLLTETLQSLQVSPDPVSLAVGLTQQFAVSSVWSNGSTELPPVSWSATGGTISATGLYTAGSSAGTFRVIASAGGKADTASVNLTSAVVTALSLTPSTVSLQPGGTQQFSAGATWSDGVYRAVTYSYTATGGVINSNGLYTAGTVAGTFAVIASCACGRADTAVVQVASGGAPTLSSLTVSPKPASIPAGSTQQFSAAALWSNGGSSLPALSWSATGGGITGAGLFTAGSTPGTYRVIVSGGGKADTAVVSVGAPAAPPDASLPNQPSGFATIQDYRFDAHPQSMVGPGTWGPSYRNRPDSEYRITSSGFSGAAPHGSSVGDMWYYEGFSGEGVEADAIGIEFTPVSKLYIAFWIQFSANWQGHGSGFDKIFHLWTAPGPNASNRVFFSAVNFRPSNDGTDATTVWPSSFAVNLQMPWGARNLIDLSRHPDFPQPPGMMGLRRGVWHRVEVLVEQNTGDNFDGTATAWVDGVQVSRYTDLRYTLSHEVKGFHYLEWAPTWGGYSPINVTRVGGMHMFMDRIYMSGRN